MRLINADDILEKAHDVTLEGGAKHRCFDTTRLYEIPAAEAIPISWLENEIELLKMHHHDTYWIQHCLDIWKGGAHD